LGGEANSGDDKDGFNILAVSGLGGATILESSDNLIGLARYIRKLPPHEKPNMLYISDLLPYYPTRGSNRSNDYLDIIEKNLQFVRDAAAALKPHMERLQRALPSNTDVVYVISDQDRRNIDELARDIGLEFKGRIAHLEKRMRDTISFIVGREAIIATTEKSLSVLSEELKNDGLSAEERKAHKAEFENASIKLKVNQEEKEEAEYRLGLINTLYMMKLVKLPEDEVTARFKQKVEESAAIEKEYDEVKRGDKNYDDVTSRSKSVSNEIRLLSERLKDIDEMKAIIEKNIANIQIDIFSHNALTPKNSHDVITELARSYYLTDIKNAFGRKRPVNIQFEKVALHEGKSGRTKLNVITAYDLSVKQGSRKKSSNDSIAEKLNTLVVNGVLDKQKLYAKPLTIVITGKNNFTSFSIDPPYDRSKKSTLAALAQGPLWSRKGVAEAWNRGINTKDTQAVENGYISSGATAIRVRGNGPIEYCIISDEYLSYMRAKDDKEEAKMLLRSNKLAELSQPAPANGKQDIAHRRELDKIVALNKRPSELKPEELPLVAGNLRGVLPYQDTDLKSMYDIEKIKVAVFTDAHVGSHSKLKVLEASVKDALARKPDVVVFGGDNLEGFLNSYAAVTRYGMTYDFVERYEEQLKSLVDKSEVNPRLVSLLKESMLKVRYNIDEQPSIFLNKLFPLIDDVSLRGGALIYTSGNHPNKTEEGWHRDEATTLAGYTVAHLTGNIKALGMMKGYIEIARNFVTSEAKQPDGLYSSPQALQAVEKVLNTMEELVERDFLAIKKALKNIRVISGSEYGADELEVNGIKMFVSHKIGKDSESSMLNFVEKKETDAVVGIAGHDHIFATDYAGGKLLVKVHSNQDSLDNPYTKRIAMPIGPFLNGYAFLELEVNKKTNSIFKANVIPVFETDLLRVDKVDEIVRDKLTNLTIRKQRS